MLRSPPFSESDARAAVAESVSWSAALRALGYQPKGRAATLDTHCGRNTPSRRRCASCREVFAPHTMRHRYCSPKCVGAANGDRLRGVAQPGIRKVQRPSYEQLKEDVRTMSMLAVGRKYGVTDNAVRKWIRWYERGFEERGETEAA